ncbi:MAG TPA: hypothetical protein VN852_06535 [Candidatus Krumholzibacteria bacterium]|nr:hypothetical protein [Candidatus Krumholzibacteria bacterium]
MATKTRSSSTASRSTMQRDREPMSGTMRRDDMQGGKHGLRKMISDGVRVTAEMPDPRVARITIDIDWQNLVSRVAREVGKKIKRRGGRAASSRTGSRRRSSRSG